MIFRSANEIKITKLAVFYIALITNRLCKNSRFPYPLLFPFLIPSFSHLPSAIKYHKKPVKKFTLSRT